MLESAEKLQWWTVKWGNRATIQTLTVQNEYSQVKESWDSVYDSKTNWHLNVN